MHQWGKQLRFTSILAFVLFVAVPRIANAAIGEICRNLGCGVECCLNGSCYEDSVEPAGTLCRASTSACDPAERCDGVSTTCPANTFSPAGTPCRAAAGPCDMAETCTGTTAACPADALYAPGVVCRVAAGTCDESEYCTGHGVECPVDLKKPAGAVCRDSAGACDVAESCDGSSVQCPADAAVVNGTACDSACVAGGTCAGGVCLAGTPELTVTPADAVVQAGTTTTVTVTHSGSGGALSLTGATLDSTGFELVDEPTWPVTLAAGESTTLGVRLAETAPGSYAATVSVSVDECAEAITADVSAEVAAAPGTGSSSGGCGTPVGSAPTTLAWFLSVMFGLRMMRRSRQ